MFAGFPFEGAAIFEGRPQFSISEVRVDAQRRMFLIVLSMHISLAMILRVYNHVTKSDYKRLDTNYIHTFAENRPMGCLHWHHRSYNCIDVKGHEYVVSHLRAIDEKPPGFFIFHCSFSLFGWIMIGQKILIVDDDLDLLQLVSVIFKKVGAHVITAHDGLDGISKFFTYRPNLVILDVMMPGGNGFDLCQRIRQASDTPVILLTALNKEHDMLTGLSIGADDFLTKPFNPEILLARARTVLRRTRHSNGESNHHESNPNYGGLISFSYNDGYLSIDIERHEVLVHGKRIKLTPIEFRLLVYLARNGGKLLTFEKILSNVWGNGYEGSMEHVHVYISHLRRKIEANPKEPCYIVTIHGIGYLFEQKEVGYKV